MSTTVDLVTALKVELKASGLTYAMLAARRGRWLSDSAPPKGCA